MRVPAAAKTFLNTFFKAQGKSAPPGAGILLDAEWETPRRAEPEDFVAMAGHVSAVTAAINGKRSDGSFIRILIQTDGELPEEVVAMLGGGDGDKAA